VLYMLSFLTFGELLLEHGLILFAFNFSELYKDYVCKLC
jgi:hypothetical protein